MMYEWLNSVCDNGARCGLFVLLAYVTFLTAIMSRDIGRLAKLLDRMDRGRNYGREPIEPDGIANDIDGT